MNWNAVVKKDHDLETGVEKSTVALAEHRWHWTLDESNPDRVSLREYARQVGSGEAAIRTMANGYAASLRDASRTLQQHLGRARMSDETVAAAEAVAKVRGVTVRTAQDSRLGYHNETRRVREIAREQAERKGTSVEEEAPKVAEMLVKQEKAAVAQRLDKASRTDFRVIGIESHLLRAYREIVQALTECQNVEFDDDGTALLATAAADVKAVLALIDSRLSGDSHVDWDAEMERLAR